MTEAPASQEEGARVLSMCLDGAAAVGVEIELQFTGGLMQRIILTGLPGSAVRESRDRIRGCLKSCDLPVPRRSVLANFAPADLHKEGNGFDLPLAVGLLALEHKVPRRALQDRVIVGEIALDGRLRPVRGALTLALRARQTGVAHLMLPWENGGEASLVDGLAVEAVHTLEEALAVLAGGPASPPPAVQESDRALLDLADVRGQASARRALEIAAAGRHNLMLVGPPGTGKTMLAQRMPGLLPPLPETATIEVTALHGLADGTPARVFRHPPFRAPHHTVTRAGLIGGGSPLRPGEVSLAHAGVLFLDEMPEFPRSLLESLRQPMEDHRVRISRAGRSVQFPADLQLIGAMNPCPCGYLGHPRRGCRCTAHARESYRRRISGPLLDRFDLWVEVPVPRADELLGTAAGESSAAVATRVARARAVPRPTVAVPASTAVRRHLHAAICGFSLSGRAVRRLVSVARTIAALDSRSEATVADLDEALSFRTGLMELSGVP